MVGILGVWNDCKAGEEATYEGWYMTEHLPERVGVPGFRSGRRFEAMSPTAERRYFTWYEVDSAAVLGSPAYVERLDNPTPWTQRIMQGGIFQRAIRAVCVRESVSGVRSGSHVIAARYDRDIEKSLDARALHTRLGSAPGVCRVQVWRRSAPVLLRETKESLARGGQDQDIAGAIIVECARTADLDQVLEPIQRMARESGDGAVVGTYRLITLLDRRDLVAS